MWRFIANEWLQPQEGLKLGILISEHYPIWNAFWLCVKDLCVQIIMMQLHSTLVGLCKVSFLFQKIISKGTLLTHKIKFLFEPTPHWDVLPGIPFQVSCWIPVSSVKLKLGNGFRSQLERWEFQRFHQLCFLRKPFWKADALKATDYSIEKYKIGLNKLQFSRCNKVTASLKVNEQSVFLYSL